MGRKDEKRRNKGAWKVWIEDENKKKGYVTTEMGI